MEKTYRLDGLDCAHCASKIEHAVQEINGVKRATIDFMTTKMIIEAPEKEMSRICDEAEKTVHQFEPDVEMKDLTAPKKEESQTGKIIQITVALIATLALVLLDPAMPWKFAAYLAVYVWIGWDVLKTAATNILKGRVFDENFLMSVATIGALAIGEYPEAVGVMLFYQIGEFFQDYAVNRSRKSISALLEIRPDYANRLIDGQVEKVAPESIKVGETIVVNPGERVPLDGKVIDGQSFVDTSALTGEAVPRKVIVGEEILSGFVNQSGRLTVKTTTTFGESTVNKILDLVENASSKKRKLKTLSLVLLVTTHQL